MHYSISGYLATGIGHFTPRLGDRTNQRQWLCETNTPKTFGTRFSLPKIDTIDTISVYMISLRKFERWYKELKQVLISQGSTVKVMSYALSAHLSPPSVRPNCPGKVITTYTGILVWLPFVWPVLRQRQDHARWPNYWPVTCLLSCCMLPCHLLVEQITSAHATLLFSIPFI